MATFKLVMSKASEAKEKVDPNSVAFTMGYYAGFSRPVTVCVTGASGYLGSHVVKQLLEDGYRVHGTVRNPDDPNKVKHLTELKGAKERLKLFKADLCKPGSFNGAMRGCTQLYHTASPFYLGTAGDDKYDEDSLLKPAIDGTLNVLNSAVKSGTVQKVVLTSSTASVYCYTGKPESHVFTEADWSGAGKLRASKDWYALSKVLAEQAAIKFCKQHNLPLVCMLPTLIWGPMLQPNLNTSCASVLSFMNGTKKAIPQTDKCVVDVRDTAAAHIRAMTRDVASGRVLLIGACVPWKDIVAQIKKTDGSLPVPTEMSTGKSEYAMVPPSVRYSCTKAQSALGLTFTSWQATLDDTVKSLKANKHYNAPK